MFEVAESINNLVFQKEDFQVRDSSVKIMKSTGFNNQAFHELSTENGLIKISSMSKWHPLDTNKIKFVCGTLLGDVADLCGMLMVHGCWILLKILVLVCRRREIYLYFNYNLYLIFI